MSDGINAELHDAVEICRDSSNRTVLMNERCQSRNEVLLCRLRSEVTISRSDGITVTLNPRQRDHGNDSSNGIYLVIKKYKSEGNASELAMNERKLLMDNEHDNIVKAFGLYESPGVPPELYMECGDCSLYQVLYSNNYQSDLQQRMAWALQAASALQFLHNRGVIHRDVKSHNMLLFNMGTLLKLCDLEFSRQVDETMTTGRGTYCWMAPEMLLPNREKAKYDFKIDCWSFAMTLYEMLFQRIPFSGCSDIKDTLRGESTDPAMQASPLKVCKNEIDQALTIDIDWLEAKFQDLHDKLKEAVNELLVYDPRYRSGVDGAIERLREAGFQERAEELTVNPEQASDSGMSAAQLERNAGAQMVTPPNRIEVTFSGGSATRSHVIVQLQPEQQMTEENLKSLHEILHTYEKVISDECRGLKYLGRESSQSFKFNGAEFDSESDLRKISQIIYGETIRNIGIAVTMKNFGS